MYFLPSYSYFLAQEYCGVDLSTGKMLDAQRAQYGGQPAQAFVPDDSIVQGAMFVPHTR